MLGIQGVQARVALQVSRLELVSRCLKGVSLPYVLYLHSDGGGGGGGGGGVKILDRLFWTLTS